MIRYAICLVFLMGTGGLEAQLQLGYEEGYSLNHEECISAYRSLEENYVNCALKEAGQSDSGRPIHLFTMGDMSAEKPTILINNAIHPGESCGVEASLILVEELLRTDSPILENINIAVIPMYNVGGALNRSCCTRANQAGPTEQGFRGNARNLDLNRDFIKTDSRNAKAFQSIFQELKPAILVDTHTSNGADYPYTMTLIHSQLDMLDPNLSSVYGESLIPHLYEAMDEHYPMAPYMNMIGATPDDGILDFPDWPRYSTGYAALFNCFGFTTEAHMLKPFSERVKATYHFLDELITYSSDHAQEIHRNKMKADNHTRALSSLFLDYTLDTLMVDSFYFKGFKAEYETSKVTGLQRLRYNRNEGWEKNIPHLKHYTGTDQVSVPSYYYIPQAWAEAIQRLAHNGVNMVRLNSDTTIQVEAYYIDSYETSPQPYEGHYLHHDVDTHKKLQVVNLLKGDYIIDTRQVSKRYIVNVLEPRAYDSFFAWGFFDAILQQKEWFSPYVFEDMAEDILAADPELRALFEEKKKDDKFAQNMWAQLMYVYQNSKYYEEEHNRYPVFRSVD